MTYKITYWDRKGTIYVVLNVQDKMASLYYLWHTAVKVWHTAEREGIKEHWDNLINLCPHSLMAQSLLLLHILFDNNNF